MDRRDVWVGLKLTGRLRASLGRQAKRSTENRFWLSFAKTLAGCEINNIAAAVSRQLSVITPGHVSIHPPVPRNAGSLLSRATESAPRESCITPTTCRVEAAGVEARA